MKKHTDNSFKHVRPKHAIISGTEKIVSASTIDVYERNGSNLFKTYHDGAITFTVSQDGIQVSRFLEEQISE
ncbi:MAG: hypothetical protein ACE5GU_11045 [Candidatus Scalinduaceae bacterium]